MKVLVTEIVHHSSAIVVVVILNMCSAKTFSEFIKVDKKHCQKPSEEPIIIIHFAFIT